MIIKLIIYGSTAALLIIIILFKCLEKVKLYETGYVLPILMPFKFGWLLIRWQTAQFGKYLN